MTAASNPCCWRFCFLSGYDSLWTIHLRVVSAIRTFGAGIIQTPR